MMVSIELTEEGSTHIDDITRALFDYIALIRAEGIAKWRYEEQAKVADLAFRFQESSSPMSFVYSTAPNLRLYPVNEVLEGPYLMEHYDEALIRALPRRAAARQPAARSQRPEGRRRQDRAVVPGAVQATRS